MEHKPEATPSVTIQVHPKEAELIRLIRERFRFGRIVVIVHDGLPQRIEETVSYTGL